MRITRWFGKHHLGIHPIIPRSDLDFILFLSGLIYSIVIAVLFTNEAFGGRTLPFLVALTFIFIIGTHGVHTITLYFYKLALEQRAQKIEEMKVKIWRYGEIIGFTLINYIAIFSPLFVLGITSKFPEQTITIVDGLAGILAGTSLWKMRMGQQPRVHYNNLFFITAVTATIATLTAITIGTILGKHIPHEVIVIYFTIFICYASHDRLLSIVCAEECGDPTHDYLIMGLVTIWGAIMFVFSGFINELPMVEITEIVIGTVGITFASEEIKRRIIKKNDEKEKTSTEETPPDEIQAKIEQADEELKEIEEVKAKENEDNSNEEQ